MVNWPSKQHPSVSNSPFSNNELLPFEIVGSCQITFSVRGGEGGGEVQKDTSCKSIFLVSKDLKIKKLLMSKINFKAFFDEVNLVYNIKIKF